MSKSVFNLLAQNNIIAIGRMDAKTSEMTSMTMNFPKSKTPFSKDRITQITKNSGIVIIGGCVKSEILLAIFNLFINLFIGHLN